MREARYGTIGKDPPSHHTYPSTTHTIAMHGQFLLFFFRPLWPYERRFDEYLSFINCNATIWGS